MEIEISKIIILSDRQRKFFDSDKLQELADSIKANGLLCPVILDENNTLVDGQRRIMACQILEKETVRFERFEGLEEWQKEIIQFETNIRREGLTWQEEVEAKLKIHELYQKKYGVLKEGSKKETTVDGEMVGWGVGDTANYLGESRGSTSQDLTLAKAIKDDPDLAKKDSKVAALKAFQIKRELSMKQEIAAVFAEIAQSKGEAPVQVRCGDSRELLKEYEDESFDFCVTDPQYGIGIHDMQHTFPNRGDVRQGIEFDDKQSVLQDVVKPIMKEVYRILKVGSHCYVFFAIARYTEVKALLEEVGFWVNPCPVFWDKNNALNLHPWIVRPVDYEPCFQCSKGYPPRPFTEIQTTSRFQHPILSGQTKVHPTEKPLPMIKWLIESCSTPKERGIDPFLGGGTFTVACAQLDRLAVGIEIDNVWWLEAKKRVEEESSLL